MGVVSQTNDVFVPGEAGIALNMRSQISMFLDVLLLDHESNANKNQKARSRASVGPQTMR